MATPINYRAWLAGAAIGLLLALLILPATSGLVRLQIKQVLGMDTDILGDKTPSPSIAASHLDDYQIQIASAARPFIESLSGQNAPEKLPYNKLVELENRFPNNPAVAANILRILCCEPPIHDRPENYWVIGKTPPQNGQPHRTQVFPYDFYDQTALSGERADPTNAYFPLMRAVGLFGQHKDPIAMSEVHQASLEPNWREYYADDIYGEWKISTLQSGAPTALMLVASCGSVLLPHYVELRDVERIYLYKALLAERAGNVKQGLSMRVDLMRYGSLMREQASSFIGNLVGIAIFRGGTSSPGGKVVYLVDTNTNHADEHRQDTFCAYLRRTGNENLIAPVTQEYDAGVVLHQSGINVALDDMWNITRLGLSWTTSLIFLATCFSLLVVGLVTTIVVRVFHLNVARPLETRYRLCVAVGAILGVVLAVLYKIDPSDFMLTGISAAVLSSAIMIILPLIHKGSQTWKDVGTKLALMLGAALAISLYIGGGLWQVGRCLLYVQSANNISGAPIISWYVVLGSVVFFAPVIAILVACSIASLRRKTPILNSMLVGLSKVSIPVSCVFLLLYGVVFIATINQERTIINETEQAIVSEGKYSALVTGHQWPGPTDWGTVSQ